MPAPSGSVASARLEALVDAIGELVRTLDPACVAGPDAARLAETYAKDEKLCAAGKLAMAARTSETGAWQKAGTRSTGEWLSELSGTSIRDAAEKLETAEHLSSQTEVLQAVRSGRVSGEQAKHICKAVAKDPGSAGRLLEAADKAGHQGLRQAFRAVSLGAGSREDDRERARRLHRCRYLRT